MTAPHDAQVEAVVRAYCDGAEVHLKCSYPTCNCKAVPRGVKAAIAAMNVEAMIRAEREVCAKVADAVAKSLTSGGAINACRYIAKTIRALPLPAAGETT